MMAWAGIPPVGQLHDMEVHRQRVQMERATVDPILRYQLREQRLSDELTAASNALVSAAKENRVTKSYMQKGY